MYKRKLEIVNKHEKNFLIILVIRKILMKISMRYHCIPFGWLKSKRLTEMLNPTTFPLFPSRLIRIFLIHISDIFLLLMTQWDETVAHQDILIAYYLNFLMNEIKNVRDMNIWVTYCTSFVPISSSFILQ